MQTIAESIVSASYQLPGVGLQDSYIEMLRLVHQYAVLVAYGRFVFADDSAIDMHKRVHVMKNGNYRGAK